jgi:hypothetical protein
MHKLETLINAVESTHTHLGDLVAFEAIIVKCKKLLLVVSPHGCGKSRASAYIGTQTPKAKIIDRLSVAGLAGLSEEDSFSDFSDVILVDDMAKSQGKYARIATMTTLAELIYSHFIHSMMRGMSFDITNFNGSAIVNIQPVILKELVESDEWEASMQDKAVRYYHLYRPQSPVNGMPEVKIDWGIEMHLVNEPDYDSLVFKEFMRSNKGQWTLARTKEHLSSFLRAAAAIDGRDYVSMCDYCLVSKLIKPLRWESLVMDKQDFESGRYLDNNQLSLFTQMVTYGKFTIEQIMDDFGVSSSKAYDLMEDHSKDWEKVSDHPAKFAPSPHLMKKLRHMGMYPHHNGTGQLEL